MRKVNFLLSIGACILLLLMAVSIFPEYFTMIDPYGKQFERLTYEDGMFRGAIPPIAPCKEFPWGTDTLGRDMKSLIIYGCKGTLLMTLFIALGRLLIALPLSIAAAYKNKAAMWIIKEFNIVFSAFPLVILCTFFARSNITELLFVNKLLPVAILLATLGWGKMANIITQRVKEILSQDFIEGEVSIGKTRLEIALQNILPHLIPNLIVLVFLEAALILVSLAQIGILRTIIYGRFFNLEGNMNTPLEFDWPSLFIFSYYLFGSDKMWLVIYPALAFAISIMGFNLFGEGLRLEFDKRNSRIISFIKKTPGILSPLRFIYQIKNFSLYKSTVIKKTIAIALIVLVAAIPKPRNPYELNVQSVFDGMPVFNEQRDTSKESFYAEISYANTLSKKLEEYGVLPFNESYLHALKTDKKQVLNSSISIDFDNESLDFKYMDNYQLEEYAPIEGSYDIEVINIESIRSIIAEKAKELDEKVILVDGLAYFKSGYYIENKIKPKALIYVMPRDVKLGAPRENQDESKTNVIWLQSEDPEQLLSLNKAKINIGVKTGYKEGVNVLGYIPGYDEKLKNEYVIIGSPINHLQNNSEEYSTSELGGSALALEVANAVHRYGIKPKRTLVFAFWGGDTQLGRGSVDFVKKYLKNTDKTAFYIDLKDLTNMQTNDLLVDTSMVMPKSQIGQQYIKALKKYADINNIKLSYGSIVSTYSKDFYDSNRQAMVISSSRRGPIFDKLYKDNGQINQRKFSKAANMIFNTIVEMALDGQIDGY